MKHIWIIFKKEMLLTLRDRRSIIVMVLIPLLLFPLIFVVTSTIQKNAAEKEGAKTLRIGYQAPDDDGGLRAILEADKSLKVQPFASSDDFRKMVREDSLDLAVALPADFGAQMAALAQSPVKVWYDQTRDGPYDRLKVHLDTFEEKLLQARLDSLHITKASIDPVSITKEPTSSMQETIGKFAGGFLPYIFIIFCYMGCMFPAIDLFTGEKERGTIETVLSTPVDRWKLLLGKLLVVVTMGMGTAFLALIGLFVGLRVSGTLPPIFMDLIVGILTPGFIVGFLLMLLPLTVFFAGLMIPATVFAKSYKEAQSILSPMNFLVIMPAVIGMMPGVELNVATALIPVLNVALATKELVAGAIDPLLYALVLVSLLALAGASVFVSFKRFGNEKNILRT